MKHIFILNPMAGKGDKIAALRESIKETCERLGTDYLIYETTARYDAEDFVRKTAAESSERLRFYACGGDGTLGEVVNGVAGQVNAEVGLIPIGTGNDFVRNFADAGDFFDIEAQVMGEARAIDLIKCNDRYGINVVNVGFDCEVVVKMDQLRRNPLVPSKLTYATAIANNFFKKFGTRMKIFADDIEIDRDMMLCAIANGGFYGGGYNAAPRAALDDGLLDVCIVEKVTRAKFIGLIGSYKAGTHLESKAAEGCITYKKCKKVALEFPCEHNFCMDGEIEKYKRVDIEIKPKAIMFAVPKKNEEKNN